MQSELEEVLNRDGYLLTKASGISMLPCIRPKKDKVLLISVKNSSQKELINENISVGKYDVILYKRENGTYILHRIIGLQEGKYVLCGDNQSIKEYGVRYEQILAVLKGIYRGDKYIDCKKNSLYLFYVRIWCSFMRRPLQMIVYIKRRLKNILKK